MPVNLHSINANIVDGENNLVTLDCIYSIEEHELADAIDSIKKDTHLIFVCCLYPLCRAVAVFFRSKTRPITQLLVFS
jgi:hypothetical protein